MSVRIVLAVAMFASALAAWWVGALFAIALSLRFRAWEVVLFGLFLDILWLPRDIFYGIPIATCLSIILVWGLEPLRRQFLFDYD